jgi:hypothetical protein
MLIKLSNLNQLLSYHPYWRKLKDRERLIIFNVVSNLVVSKDTYIGMPKNNTVGWQSVHSIPTIPNLYQQNIESLGFSSYKMVDYELSEVEHELMYEGISWAKPDIKDLREKMRKAFEKEDFESKKECAITKAKEYTWEISALKFMELIHG